MANHYWTHHLREYVWNFLPSIQQADPRSSWFRGDWPKLAKETSLGGYHFQLPNSILLLGEIHPFFTETWFWKKEKSHYRSLNTKPVEMCELDANARYRTPLKTSMTFGKSKYLIGNTSSSMVAFFHCHSLVFVPELVDMIPNLTRFKDHLLDAAFKYVLIFTPISGEMFQFDEYWSSSLKRGVDFIHLTSAPCCGYRSSKNYPPLN